MDEEVLRRVIRRKLQRARLPHDGIRTVWSTPSDGETCDTCDTVLTRNQLLMEAVLLGAASACRISTSQLSLSSWLCFTKRRVEG
jgi:hypothetical protein